MKIDQRTFKERLISDQIPFWTATTIIGRSYCGPMTAKGLCPQNCNLCAPKLQEVLDLTNARNPSALLTWKLRDLIAKNQEECHLHEHTEPKKDALGLEFDGNPFEAILNEIQTA
jgi:hypothetical protein